VTAMSAVAFASAEIQLRGDVVGTNSFTDLTNTSRPGASYMQAQYARLNFKGKINEQFFGRFQLDFLQSQGLNGLKAAEIDHAINDMFQVGFGRLSDPGIGGFEGTRAYYDMWFISQAYQGNFPFGAQLDVTINPDHKVKLVLLNAGWTGTNSALGGGISYAGGNQSLNPGLNPSTNTNPQTAPATAPTYLGYGLRYEGNFGPIVGRASYHVDPLYTSGSVNNNSYLGVGVKYTMGDLDATLDYLSDTFTSIGTSNNDNGTKNTVVLMADYSMGMFKPHLKFESTTVQDVPAAYYVQSEGTLATSALWGSSLVSSGAYQNAITRYDIGANIYPNGQKDPFYYSVNYVGQSNVFSGAGATYSNKTVTESAIFASIVAMNDILK